MNRYANVSVGNRELLRCVECSTRSSVVTIDPTERKDHDRMHVEADATYGSTQGSTHDHEPDPISTGFGAVCGECKQPLVTDLPEPGQPQVWEHE
jgi:hypothetical protein